MTYFDRQWFRQLGQLNAEQCGRLLQTLDIAQKILFEQIVSSLNLNSQEDLSIPSILINEFQSSLMPDQLNAIKQLFTPPSSSGNKPS